MQAIPYASFLEHKRSLATGAGFDSEPGALNPALFPFQRDLVLYALHQGRAALFADPGLGKTIVQLSYADEIVKRTNGNVLILAPLAVSHQTVLEAAKFGIEARRSNDGTAHRGITVTNYERLHLFNRADFVGVVADESSRIKAFDGVRRAEVTAFMRHMSYRLLCSATPAPNDYIELGTSSEALGYLGNMDMLNRFFKNDKNNSATGRFHGNATEWRFKGHAEEPFWRWVCSWARAMRKPSDLGYDDGDFILPPLIEQQHVIDADVTLPGMLFSVEAVTLQEQRAERRGTLDARCEKVAALVKHDQPALVWVHLNTEGDLLERLIPDALQVSGNDSDDAKEEKLIAFSSGQARVLVTKPSICSWGMNWQHCAHVTFFPSHSFESYYQGVRRCWRFGQKRAVTVDIVTTPGERRVLENLQKKAAAADVLFSQLVAMMHEGLHVSRTDTYDKKVTVPQWLTA